MRVIVICESCEAQHEENFPVLSKVLVTNCIMCNDDICSSCAKNFNNYVCDRCAEETKDA